MCCVNPKSDIGLLSHLADGTPEGGLTVSDRDVAGEFPGGQQAWTGTPGTLHHPAEKTHRYVQKYFAGTEIFFTCPHPSSPLWDSAS